MDAAKWTAFRGKKQLLHEVTKSIFNGPRFARSYVNAPEYGVPFLGSIDILLADLSHLSYLSKKQVAEDPDLLIEEGWTLITCSGTIGRMAYARPEMNGMAGSQHFMRVVPNTDAIPSGYLYAYLSSSFGVPIVVSATYGAIIQHIEPHHLANLLVPRLAEEIENKVHNLIERAAINRSEASRLLEQAKSDVVSFFGFNPPTPLYKYETPSITAASSSSIIQRLDAYYYARWNEDAVNEFSKTVVGKAKKLSDIEVTKEVFIPDIFKRMYVDNPAYGYPYLSGAEVYRLAPTSERYLSKKVPNIKELVLHDGMILIQDSGQLGGLIGRPVLVGRYLDGFACTNNMVRIVPHTEEDQGYIFAVLSTDYGVRLLMREATGSSIPHLEVKRIKNIQIPWPDEETRHQLAHKVLLAKRLREDASDLEIQARQLVERTIREG
jgi:type I restriction enzyme S subunit